jgi:peptide deformylase
MAIKEILLLGNPLLRKKCPAVKKADDPATRRIISDLADTLNNFRKQMGFGRGIAAPQIGAAIRIIFINVDGPMALINPRIVSRSRTMMALWDDCFSFPDILVKLKRHSSVTVEYLDENGSKRRLIAKGGLSELLQHEIDHLDGILAIDRAIDSKHIILRSEYDKMTKKELDTQTL